MTDAEKLDMAWRLKTLAEICRIALIVEKDKKERTRIKKELKWVKAKLTYAVKVLEKSKEDAHD
jgi:hypothetical protein